MMTTFKEELTESDFENALATIDINPDPIAVAKILPEARIEAAITISAAPNINEPIKADPSKDSGKDKSGNIPSKDWLDQFGQAAQIIAELLKEDNKFLLNWIQGWACATTILHSFSDVVCKVGERLIFSMGNADDQAQLMFNNEFVATKAIEQGVTNHFASGKIRPGKNWVIIRVSNVGCWDWFASAAIYRASDRRQISYMAGKGNDGIYKNEHLLVLKIWGR